MYRESLLKEIVNKETVSTTLKSLSLDLFQEGFDDLSHRFYERIDNLKDFFNIKEHEANLKRLDSEIEKLKKCIDKGFNKNSNINYTKKVTIKKYGKIDLTTAYRI
ncbi:MAG: hypothetical protein K2P52_06240 [Campylobacterales bacterium]|nr:hypothetical protein [Campylobacterales bacterium]